MEGWVVEKGKEREWWVVGRVNFSGWVRAILGVRWVRIRRKDLVSIMIWVVLLINR